jgi:hypothetical protein
MGATASVLTGKTGKNRPNVVSKITFANAKALTAEQEKFIREAYATAAGLPIEEVALAQDPDRALTYIVTVYVKDEDQARKVMTKGLKVQAGCCGLRDIAGVKSALKNTVLGAAPRLIMCVCLSVRISRLTPLPSSRPAGLQSLHRRHYHYYGACWGCGEIGPEPSRRSCRKGNERCLRCSQAEVPCFPLSSPLTAPDSNRPRPKITFLIYEHK